MKRKLFVFFLCLMLTALIPLTAYADMGPKPSVKIQFTGAPDQIYYGTLLSERRSTGPASAWDGVSPYSHYQYGEEGAAIWQKFAAYEDTDGFYFLQEWWECSEDNWLRWTYYPPSPFKILLYFPESDRFCVSPVYERYAFDSYFTVDLSSWESGSLTAQVSYDHTWELVSLAARILLTVLLEIAAAWLFGYRERRLLGFICSVNLATQIVLNVWLNLVNYRSGPWNFTFMYVLLELAVFVIEASLYSALFSRLSTQLQKRGRAVGYAFIANAGSFAAGLWLAHQIPGIF